MIGESEMKPKALSPMDELKDVEEKAYVNVMRARNAGRRIRGFTNQLMHLD
jgi:hypothetical protein